MTTEKFDTYTNNKLETICPYCGEENEHDAESLSWNDDESGEVTCGACEREYWQKVSVSYSRESFTLEEILEDEIENLERDIKHKEKEPRYAKFCEQWKKELETKKEKLHALELTELERDDEMRDY